MSEPRLSDWLASVGFTTVEADLGIEDPDDPWGDLAVAVTPLSTEQRAFLLGPGVFDDGSIDPRLLAEAEQEIIEIPAEPDDIEPF